MRRKVVILKLLEALIACVALAGVVVASRLVDGWGPLWTKLALLPVLWSAWRFGLIGGALCAATASAFLAPWLLTYWGELDVHVWSDIAELIVLNIVAWVFGAAVDYNRRSSRRADGLTRELRSANAELAELVALRGRAADLERLESISRLAGGVAHELRNPLAAIKLTAQTLSRREDTEKIREELSLIEEEVGRADEVVRRLIRRVEPGDGAEVFPLRGLLEEALEEVEPLKGKLTLSARLPELRLTVRGDQRTLGQAVVNLLVNALEAAEGEVELSVTAVSAHSSHTLHDEVAVIVEDDGPGIEAAAAHRIFDAFYTTKPRGTGLGLYLALQAALSAGGSLEYAPRSPRGARFSLTLPVARG